MTNSIDPKHFDNFVKEELLEDNNLLLRLWQHFQNHIDELTNTNFSREPSDLISIKDSAHKLKSSCHSFGAKNLASMLEELEKRIASVNIEESGRLFQACKKEAQQAHRELSQLIDDTERQTKKSA